VAVTALSILFLGVADRFTKHLTSMEAVRRKIFHIGPILIIPIVHFLNNSVLILIIAPAFSLLLLLEMVRYH
jgi:hypothetical protein